MGSIGPHGWSRNSTELEKECVGRKVSRRRRHGDMCSCRRRISGPVAVGHGLQPGWKCGKDDRIIFNGVNTENMVCCCKEGGCTREAVRRGDAQEIIEEFGKKDGKKDGKQCC